MRFNAGTALIGALLAISPAGAATIVSQSPPQPTARPDPAPNVPRPAAKKAAVFYNYNAAGPVSEHFIRTDGPAARDKGWRANARFYRHPRFARSAYHWASRRSVVLDSQGFTGGVGYGTEGGGYGGQGYLYFGRGSDAPSNGGGVSLSPGYGPTYRGVWQGPVNPTRGGFSRH